jgi:transcription elongation factor Elf1
MSNTNANVRSLRDKFQHQPANQYSNVTKNRQDQKHDISFQCMHCGRHQTVTLLLQSNIPNGVCLYMKFRFKIKDLCTSSTYRRI